jgi:hypothetical protein
MFKMLQLFDEYVLKAVVMTESILDSDYTDGNKLENFTQNRERLLSVIEKISLEIDWDKVDFEHREELNRKIEYIKVLDVKLLTKLQEYQEQVKKDIEITFKQKENIKGYNLSDVK